MITHHKASSALSLLALALFVGTTFGQPPQDEQAIDRLAQDSANQVAATNAKRVLLAPLQNCLREKSICLQLEMALRSSLGNTGVEPQFVARDEVNDALARKGLMGIDGYDREVLRWIASDVGADLLVTENMLWNPKITGLSTELIDVAKGSSIGKYTGLFENPISASDDSVLVKDSESGVPLIVFYSRASGIKVPTCRSCPDPLYSVELLKAKYQGTVRLQVTITAEGIADQIAVVGTLDPAVAQSAIRTVSQWHFNPAIGTDGQPFPTRRPVEVAFRLR